MKKAKSVDGRLDPQAVFSSMPPVECLKMMVSEMMIVERGDGAKTPTKRMAIWGLSTAHFYGEAERKVYKNLPEEMAQEGFVGKLQRMMHGTQDASHIWGETWIKPLNKADIVEGKANRALFRGAGVMGFCHGDDSVGLGDDEDLEKFGAHLKKVFDLRPSSKIGFGEGVEKVMTVLNRKVIIDDDERVVKIEADEQHVPKV